jgi:hypothetical protein
MSQSTMRGMRLGANSLESEVNVRFEARTKQAYECALGHLGVQGLLQGSCAPYRRCEGGPDLARGEDSS